MSTCPYLIGANGSSFVTHYRSGERFEFTSTARGEARSLRRIVAEVLIPQEIPLFGSPTLEGYPISVRVSPDCTAVPEAFVVVMAHELSHVLLATLLSPDKDNELCADLVPILLGFGDIIKVGRQWRTSTGTATYGYLSDQQFGFAHQYVDVLMKSYQARIDALMRAIAAAQRRLKTAERILSAFRAHFKHLDEHRPTRMNKEHARRIIELHSCGKDSEWATRIGEFRTAVDDIERFAMSTSHYSEKRVQRFETCSAHLDACMSELSGLAKEIATDAKMLLKYASVGYRVRAVLTRYPYPGK